MDFLSCRELRSQTPDATRTNSAGCSSRSAPEEDVLVRTRAKLGADGRLIFVELDLGSEPLTTLAAKLDSFDALRAGAIEYAEAQALFVVVGDGRRRRVEALVAERRVRVVAPQDIADALAACSRNVFARPRRGERTAGGVQLCKVATVSGLRKVGV